MASLPISERVPQVINRRTYQLFSTFTVAILFLQGCAAPLSQPHPTQQGQAKASSSTKPPQDKSSSPQSEDTDAIPGFAQYRNSAISLYYPQGWTIDETAPNTIRISTPDTVVFFAWIEQQEDAGFAFDKALEDKASQDSAQAALEQNTRKYLATLGATLKRLEPIELKALGPLRVFAHKAFVGTVQIPRVTDKEIEIIAVPSVECSSFLSCGITYMRMVPPGITDNDWTLLHAIAGSVREVNGETK